MSRSVAEAATWGRGPCSLTTGQGNSGRKVLPRLARPAPGRRLRIQPQVGEDLPDDRPLVDGRDDVLRPYAAVR
jgi:hypothetical protein